MTRMGWAAALAAALAATAASASAAPPPDELIKIEFKPIPRSDRGVDGCEVSVWVVDHNSRLPFEGVIANVVVFDPSVPRPGVEDRKVVGLKAALVRGSDKAPVSWWSLSVGDVRIDDEAVRNDQPDENGFGFAVFEGVRTAQVSAAVEEGRDIQIRYRVRGEAEGEVTVALSGQGDYRSRLTACFTEGGRLAAAEAAKAQPE